MRVEAGLWSIVQSDIVIEPDITQNKEPWPTSFLTMQQFDTSMLPALLLIIPLQSTLSCSTCLFPVIFDKMRLDFLFGQLKCMELYCCLRCYYSYNAFHIVTCSCSLSFSYFDHQKNEILNVFLIVHVLFHFCAKVSGRRVYKAEFKSYIEMYTFDLQIHILCYENYSMI